MIRFLWRLWRIQQRGAGPLLRLIAAFRSEPSWQRERAVRWRGFRLTQPLKRGRDWALDWAPVRSLLTEPFSWETFRALLEPPRRWATDETGAVADRIRPERGSRTADRNAFAPYVTDCLPYGTYNAAWFPGATREIQINACIAAVAADPGGVACWLNSSMLGFNVNLVTLNNAVRMFYEGQGNYGEFDLRAYGAAIDNATPDLAAWNAAIAAAHAYAGTLPNGTPVPLGPGSVAVRHPGGVSLINGTVTIPNGSIISVLGSPSAVIKATGTAFGPMMVLDAAAGGFGSRFGVLRDLTFEGNSIATIGLDVGLCVQRIFENVVITHATSVGLRVRTTQNCTFTNVNSEDNGGAGAFDCQLLLDLGCGNNSFFKCEFDVTQDSVSRGFANVIFRASGATPAGGFGAGPTDNIFWGCVIERTSTTTAAAIYHRAGRGNSFFACDINAQHAASGVAAPVGFWADGADVSGAFKNELMRFVHCKWAGTQANSICFKLQNNCNPCEVSNCLIEGFNVAFQIDDTSYADLGEPVAGSYNTFVQPLGVKKDFQLVGQHVVNVQSAPTGFQGGPVYNPGVTNALVYDSLLNTLNVFNGSWKFVGLDQGGVQPTYGTVVQINMATGKYQQIRVTDGVAFTVNNPTNTLSSKEVVLDFWNNSGGAMGAVTFGANWKLNGAFVAPANAFHALYTFVSDQAAGTLHEVSRSVAVPH